MKPRSIAAMLPFVAVLAACSGITPSGTRVSDVAALAGTYTGSMDERGFAVRQARLVVQRDGSFEITIGEPKGLRTNGFLTVRPDGSLTYRYADLMGTGSASEGGGQRVIVLIQSDGDAKITVSTKVP